MAKSESAPGGLALLGRRGGALVRWPVLLLLAAACAVVTIVYVRTRDWATLSLSLPATWEVFTVTDMTTAENVNVGVPAPERKKKVKHGKNDGMRKKLKGNRVENKPPANASQKALPIEVVKPDRFADTAPPTARMLRLMAFKFIRRSQYLHTRIHKSIMIL